MDEARWTVMDRWAPRVRVEHPWKMKVRTRFGVDALNEWSGLSRRQQRLVELGSYVVALLALLVTGAAIAGMLWYIATAEIALAPPPAGAVDMGLWEALRVVGIVALALLILFTAVIVVWNVAVVLLLPLMATHELAHAAVAVTEGCEVQEFGLYFYGPVCIAAFVDIYDPEWRSRRPESMLSVYAAGPLSDLLIGTAMLSVYVLATGGYTIPTVTGVGNPIIWLLGAFGTLQVIGGLSNLVALFKPVDGYHIIANFVRAFPHRHQPTLKRGRRAVGNLILVGWSLAVYVQLGNLGVV